MRSQSNPRGVVFAFVLLALAGLLSACSGPEFKYPKPEKFDDTGLMQASESPTEKMIVSSVQKAVDVFYVNLFPHLKTLSEMDRSCEGCDEMRRALTGAQRGARLTYIAFSDAGKDMQRISPKTDREKKLALIGNEIVQEMQVITALTLLSLPDADAYVRAKDEKNLDQLTEQNEASLRNTLSQIEKVRSKILLSREKLVATLQNL